MKQQKEWINETSQDADKERLGGLIADISADFKNTKSQIESLNHNFLADLHISTKWDVKTGATINIYHTIMVNADIFANTDINDIISDHYMVNNIIRDFYAKNEKKIDECKKIVEKHKEEW